MHAYFQFANKSKQPSCKRRSALFCILPGNRFRPGGANRRAGVQLILVQGSSPPRIVLLWDPRGAGQGVCGPRGGAFTNTADAENLNCKGGKNRAGWMADILGWHNDQVGWLGRVPRVPVQLHNWNRHPNTSPAGQQNWTRDRVWSVPGKWKKVDFIPLAILYGR